MKTMKVIALAIVLLGALVSCQKEKPRKLTAKDLAGTIWKGTLTHTYRDPNQTQLQTSYEITFYSDSEGTAVVPEDTSDPKFYLTVPFKYTCGETFLKFEPVIVEDDYFLIENSGSINYYLTGNWLLEKYTSTELIFSRQEFQVELTRTE